MLICSAMKGQFPFVINCSDLRTSLTKYLVLFNIDSLSKRHFERGGVQMQFPKIQIRKHVRSSDQLKGNRGFLFDSTKRVRHLVRHRKWSCEFSGTTHPPFSSHLIFSSFNFPVFSSIVMQLRHNTH